MNGAVLVACISANASAALVVTQKEHANQQSQTQGQIYFEALSDIAKGRYLEGRVLIGQVVLPEGRFERLARIIIADTYYREGGARNLALAAESYNEFLQFFPEDHLAPHVMLKMAEIYLRQFVSPHGTYFQNLAERALRRLQTSHPAFKSAQVAEYLAICDEFSADHDLRVAKFYWEVRESPTPVMMRCQEILSRRPRFSRMDEALWYLALAEESEGDIDEALNHYERIVADYSHSQFRFAAATKLKHAGRALPETDSSKGADLEQRGVRMAAALQDMKSGCSMFSRRGVLLDESDRVDPPATEDSPAPLN